MSVSPPNRCNEDDPQSTTGVMYSGTFPAGLPGGASDPRSDEWLLYSSSLHGLFQCHDLLMGVL